RRCVRQKRDIEAQTAGEGEAGGRRPLVLCIEAKLEHAEVRSRGSVRAPKPPVVVARESPRERVETAEEPSPGRPLHWGGAAVKPLALLADGHEGWPAVGGHGARGPGGG